MNFYPDRFCSPGTTGITTVKKQSERSEIAARYKWNLQDIYIDDAKWQDDFNRVRSMLPEVASLPGKVGECPENLLKTLTISDEIKEILGKLVVYATMHWHEDMRATTYHSASDRANSLLVEVRAALAFIEPEIIALSDQTIDRYLEKNPGLQLYRHSLDDLLRRKKHILSDKEEQLLALANDPLGQPQTIFSMFDNADLTFPHISDAEGNEVELTRALYLKLLEESDRNVRIRAFKNFWPEYLKMKNTLAATLFANVKRDIFYARTRKYNNCLEASLDNNNIPVSVYHNLIKTINANLAPLHRYLKLRKQVLKLEEQHPYDLYCPLTADVKWEVPYEEAVNLVQKALAPLGQKYLTGMATGFDSGWIDVYENKGKKSGGYSWGSYGTHPYILMNYMDRLQDLFTLAHEMGHSMHTHFSNENQPVIYADYSIFLAEIASTVNEALLMDYLIKNTRNNERKLFLITHHLRQIVNTVYTQTLYAEFELLIHQFAESGQPLTVDLLSQTCHELTEKYYGPDLTIDPEFDLNWARIPHFYYNFYVYQYATGYAAAITIARKLLAGDREMQKRYLEFLSSGSSDYSIDILKKAGIDMTDPKPIKAAVQLFENLLDDLEKILWT